MCVPPAWQFTYRHWSAYGGTPEFLMNNKPGYLKLWRKFGDTSFFKNSYCVHLAIYLLMEANYETKKQWVNGKEITIHRGQCLTGLYSLRDATGISIQSLRTALATLGGLGFLTSKSTNRYRIITIGNFHHYQTKSTSRLTNHQQATNKLPTTPKEVKKERREEEKTTEPYTGKAGGGLSEQSKGEGEQTAGNPPKAPGKETAEAYIVRCYKTAIGIPADDYDWDMGMGPKCLVYAQKIVNTFPGDKRYATEWASNEIIKVKEWADKNGKDFSLALIAHKALNAKGKWLEERANQEKYARGRT